MGLFSRNKPVPPSKDIQTGEIYVFLRAIDLRSAAYPVWSVAVSQSPQSSPRDAVKKNTTQPQAKRKKSLFSLQTKSSPKSDVSHGAKQPKPTTSTQNEVYEFTLSSGNLDIIHHKASAMPTYHIVTETESDSESMLLKILLPLSSPNTPSQRSAQPLSLQIEQALYRITSMTTDFHDTETDQWLKLALATLQNDKFIAPATSGLNVEKFMDFARNSLTEFEGDLLQRQYAGEVLPVGNSGVDAVDLRARHVKVVDYAACVKEDERLRARFGHGYGVVHGDGGRNDGGDEVLYAHGGQYIGRSQDQRRGDEECEDDNDDDDDDEYWERNTDHRGRLM